MASDASDRRWQAWVDYERAKVRRLKSELFTALSEIERLKAAR